MLTSEFDFAFPPDRIAMHPAPRGEAKLMVVPRGGSLPSDFPLAVESEGWAFGQAKDIVRILRPGDALALNDTKVLRARLRGRLENGGACEVLLLAPVPGSEGGNVWECLAKPGKKLERGRRVDFAPDFWAETVGLGSEGERLLDFSLSGDAFFQALDRHGEIPLPPYIRRPPEKSDADTYQSLFAAYPGSVAAPTASLHFSETMLHEAARKGVSMPKLTLHVGAGTFRPVQSERIEDHPMHSETYSLPDPSAEALNAVRRNGGKIFAVGTTAARTLETCCDEQGRFGASSGQTRLFIQPGYNWKAVDALWTNFHWPRSTLFIMVCAMLGTDKAKAAYAEAMQRDFRLFSYGDAMLIL